MNRRISSVLLHLAKNVSLRFHVNLVGKNKEGIEVPNLFHTTYENSKGKYHSYDVFSYITLEIKDYEAGWDKSKSVLINTRNMFQFITHVNRMIANIYQPDSFYVDPITKETKVNLDKYEEYSVNAYNLGQGQYIRMEPSLVYDHSEDTLYEGALFMLNKKDNFFYIPIDWLESMKYNLEKVDFFIYTHLMLQYYFTVIYDKNEVPMEPVKKQPHKPHVFYTDKKVEVVHMEPEELQQIASSIVKEPSLKETFDL